MKDTTPDALSGWFAGRVPDEWFTGPPAVTVDGDQVKVTGPIAAPALADGASAEARAGAEAGRISRFREQTRRGRIWVAREAEHRFEVLVQWGATCGGTTTEFTPGGSGRSRGEGEAAGPGEASRQVEI